MVPFCHRTTPWCIIPPDLIPANIHPPLFRIYYLGNPTLRIQIPLVSPIVLPRERDPNVKLDPTPSGLDKITYVLVISSGGGVLDITVVLAP